jgi:hypothetical protein
MNAEAQRDPGSDGQTRNLKVVYTVYVRCFIINNTL